VARITPSEKKRLVSTLEVADGDAIKADELSMEQMSLPRSLLKLAGIDQEQEYRLCHSLAKHLLEKVPEPEEINLE
jgi:hypothetical protein